MINDVIVGAAGRGSELKADSAHEGILALQALTCLIKEAILTILLLCNSNLPDFNISSTLKIKTSSQARAFQYLAHFFFFCTEHSSLTQEIKSVKARHLSTKHIVLLVAAYFTQKLGVHSPEMITKI